MNASFRKADVLFFCFHWNIQVLNLQLADALSNIKSTK